MPESDAKVPAGDATLGNAIPRNKAAMREHAHATARGKAFGGRSGFEVIHLLFTQ
jgi:hypothetical protein